MLQRRVCGFALILAASLGDLASAAPRFNCYTVRPGDNAAQIAVRLTGNARSWREAWFQILDPAASTFVPKSAYTRIQPGWQACVATEMRGGPPHAVTRQATLPRWWWCSVLFFTTMLAWILAGNYADRRQATSSTLERFGNTFVREFARPLIQEPCAEPPLRSRLCVIPHSRRLEVLLAPSRGRHYPNLSDHRRNVEYDVERVMALVGDGRFVRDSLGARGPWVVIPFRLEAGVKKEGEA